MRADRRHHYRLIHRSTYRYSAPVTSSYGRAMLTPRDGGGQHVHRSGMQVTPRPAETAQHLDVSGNQAAYFHVAQEHDVLEVLAQALVTVSRRRPDLTALPALSWESAVADVSAMRATGQGRNGEGPASVMTIVESALASPLAAPEDAVLEYALSVFHPGERVTDAVVALCDRIHAELEYRPGTSSTDRTLADVLATRSGSCHDYAHLAVGCLRSMGLAARYVTGFVRDGERLRGAGRAHAWAAVWVPGGGWIHLDPSNGGLVDHRYVVLG